MISLLKPSFNVSKILKTSSSSKSKSGFPIEKDNTVLEKLNGKNKIANSVYQTEN